MNESLQSGTLLSCVGGLYTVRSDGGALLPCRARGAFRHARISPLPGDRVDVLASDAGEFALDAVHPRKNALIRPPLANLDMLLVVIAAAQPAPSLLIADKLITIAEFHHIEPVSVLTKAELDRDFASRTADAYRRCGFSAHVVCSMTGEGVAALREEVLARFGQGVSAAAGVSGAGKSTLLNAMFALRQETGALSDKIARGKNTTRRAELFPLDTLCGDASLRGFFADTPGFSLLDFERFNFYGRDDLPYVFREFAPYLGRCRYTKCTHTKEDGCAVLDAVRVGDIPAFRHESYLALYADLKNKREWNS